MPSPRGDPLCVSQAHLVQASERNLVDQNQDNPDESGIFFISNSSPISMSDSGSHMTYHDDVSFPRWCLPDKPRPRDSQQLRRIRHHPKALSFVLQKIQRSGGSSCAELYEGWTCVGLLFTVERNIYGVLARGSRGDRRQSSSRDSYDDDDDDDSDAEGSATVRGGTLISYFNDA